MISFLKSELFRNFLGGFALGIILVLTFQGDDEAVALEDSSPVVEEMLAS